MRAFLVSLLFSLALPLMTQAEFIEAELRIDGMACPFCAFGIEKKLRDVEGVRDLEVLLDEGVIELGFEADAPVTVRSLEEAVEKAGFTLRGLRLAARGKLVSTAPSPTLDAGRAGRFLLLEEREGRPRPIAAETEDRIRRASANGVVAVRGEIRLHKEGPPALVLEEFEAGP